MELEEKVESAISRNNQLKKEIIWEYDNMTKQALDISQQIADVKDIAEQYTFDASLLSIEQNSIFNLEQESMYAFFAYATANRDYETGQRIRFDGIITNAGDGYDVSENVFNCVQNGYYMFHVGAYSNVNRIRARISRSGVGVCTILAYGSNEEDISDATDHGSNTCIMTCGPGEYVEVEAITYTGMTLLGGSAKHSTFSGFFLLPI